MILNQMLCYYSLEESDKVCQNDFRIPKESEWEEYVQILIELKNVPKDLIDYTTWSNGKGSGKAMNEAIGELTFFEEPNPLNLEATGLIQGDSHVKDGAMTFWSRMDGSPDLRHHLHIESK